MTPVFCKIKHNPPDAYGDCLRACVASLLDCEADAVPHFADNHPPFEDMITAMRAWLIMEHDCNAHLAHFDASLQSRDIREFMARRNPDIYYLLFSENHVVVCLNEKIAHDPAWYNTTLTQPREAWTVMVLTK